MEQILSVVDRGKESLKQEADRHRTLAIERDKLLQDIRVLPGFERFLLRKEFSQLRASAHSGPVVILNAAESRCDALIILADVDHVIHVPLPSFNFRRSAGLQKMLEKLLGDARVIPCDNREGKSATRGCDSWEPLLSTLWNGVVKPVLDALAFSVRDIVSLELVADPFHLSPNRFLETYHAFFGARLALSCFFLSMQLVYMAPSIRNQGKTCPTS